MILPLFNVWVNTKTTTILPLTPQKYTYYNSPNIITTSLYLKQYMVIYALSIQKNICIIPVLPRENEYI